MTPIWVVSRSGEVSTVAELEARRRQARREQRRLGDLPMGTRFAFYGVTCIVGRPATGVTGTVVGKGAQGGVLVEARRRTDKRWVIERVEWSGFIYVQPLSEKRRAS